MTNYCFLPWLPADRNRGKSLLTLVKSGFIGVFHLGVKDDFREHMTRGRGHASRIAPDTRQTEEQPRGLPPQVFKNQKEHGTDLRRKESTMARPYIQKDDEVHLRISML